MRPQVLLGLLWIGGLLGAPCESAPLSFRAELAADQPARPILIELHLASSDPDGEPVVLNARLEAGKTTILEIPDRHTFRIDAHAAGYWIEPQWLPASAADRPQELLLKLYPAGTLTVALEGPPGEKTPDRLEVRLQPPPSRTAAHGLPGKTTVSCIAAAAERHWSCILPAGTFDLRFRAGHLVPIYRWEMSVEGGKTRDLGVLHLARGASVVGRIELESAAPRGAAPCRIEILPYVPSLARDRKLADLKRSTQVNERGFFQFEGMPPGVYVVTATQEGFAPVRVFPVEVKNGLESEIVEPLRLKKPVPVEIVLSPPVDPEGQSWAVQVQEKDLVTGVLGEGVRAAASAEGIWRRADLPPGKYLVSILGGLDSRWLAEEIEVQAGAPPYHLEVPVLDVRGRVFLGDGPLAATVWLGGSRGIRRMRFDADEKGHFSGVLPGEGRWNVDIVAERQRLRLTLDPIEVHKEPGKSYALIEIHVPNTLLRGEVVDENGHAVEGAVVVVQNAAKDSRPSEVQSDERGEFEIRGQKPGALVMQAQAADQRNSGWVNAQVEEGKETPRLRLVVRPKRDLQGRVLSPDGPVPGAEVIAWPGLGGVAISTVETGVTDPSGDFRLGLPAGSPTPSLFVHAPGNALHFSLVTTPGEPVVVMVQPTGGTLVLDGIASGILVHRGAFIPVGLLARWGQRGDRPDRLTVPNMEPGDYIFCTGGAASTAIRQGTEPPAGTCSAGYLSALGTLSLKTGSPE